MKYKLTDETMTKDSGVVLHRIECVTAFSDVEVGEKGGHTGSIITNIVNMFDKYEFADGTPCGKEVDL